MTTQELQKVNTAGFKFGMSLLDKGRWFIRNTFKINPSIYDRGVVANFLIDQLGLATNQMSIFDEKYYLTQWNKIGEIIDYDLINQMVYHYDFADCDNFGFMFASRASFLYNLNSFGVAVGDVFNLSGQKIGRHCFNLILTKEANGLKLYCYEPMTDGATTITKGNKIIIGSWEYRIDWCIFY